MRALPLCAASFSGTAPSVAMTGFCSALRNIECDTPPLKERG